MMDLKYKVNIYWSENDNAYIAEMPELAGCMADGKTYEEALKNIETIAEEWIETAELLGRKIPSPRPA
jgi:predicted RNase H-like HicB family nuclease